jgi:hypothetical protein
MSQRRDFGKGFSAARSQPHQELLPPPPVARDQARPDSDLDLLVDLPPNAALLERIALKLAL